MFIFVVAGMRNALLNTSVLPGILLLPFDGVNPQQHLLHTVGAESLLDMNIRMNPLSMSFSFRQSCVFVLLWAIRVVTSVVFKC